MATVSSCTFSNDTASNDGGGLYNKGTLTVSSSTFSGDWAAGGGGGAIFNSNTLTVTSSTFATNHANNGWGGGIDNSNTLTVTSSTFTGNSAYSGGGIFNGGTATVTSSTFSINPAQGGGGICNNIGDAITLASSTFSGNSAGSGGGICNLGTLTAASSTFSGNSAAADGGGIFANSNQTLVDTIIAGNTTAGGGPDIYGNVTAQYCLVEDAGSTYGNNVTSTLANGNKDFLVPDLGPLADNGGPTETMALLSGSPALNAGSVSLLEGLATDQRGESRTLDGATDMGAYEHSDPNLSTIVGQPLDVSAPSPLTDGSLVLPLDAAGLTYVSGANAKPIVAADVSLCGSNGSGIYLESVSVSVTLDGVAAPSVPYEVPRTITGYTTCRLAVQVNTVSTRLPAGLPTGRYNWTMQVTENYSNNSHVQCNSISGQQDVLNWTGSGAASPYGLPPQWSLTGVDYLVADSIGGVSLVESDGAMAYFAPSGADTYTAPNGPFGFDTLVGDWTNGFTLTGTDGTQQSFSPQGRLTGLTDNDGNATSYNWTGNHLASIVNPAGQTTTLAYSSGLLASITDFAGRVTTLGYSNGLLTSITQPDPNNAVVSGEATPVTQLTYTATAQLAGVVDPDGNQTQYAYDTLTGGLTTITNPDGTVESYQAAQTLPLDNAAITVLPTSAVQATSTDENGDTTSYILDQYGNPLAVTNALGQTTVYVRPAAYTASDTGLSVPNVADLATEMDQPDPATGQHDSNSPKTYYSYNSLGEMTSETSPDDSTQSWQYATYYTDGGPDEVANLYQDGLGNQTVYSYDPTTGDLLYAEQYANGQSPSNSQDYIGNYTLPGEWNPGQSTTPGGDPSPVRSTPCWAAEARPALWPARQTPTAT